MADMTDDEIDAGLRLLVESGEAETMVDEVTGAKKFRLTDKGRTHAAELVKELAARNDRHIGAALKYFEGRTPDVCATCSQSPEALPGVRLCRSCLEVAWTVAERIHEDERRSESRELCRHTEYVNEGPLMRTCYANKGHVGPHVWDPHGGTEKH